MEKSLKITVAALAVIGIAGGIMALNKDSLADVVTEEQAATEARRELAQATPVPFADPAAASAVAAPSVEPTAVGTETDAAPDASEAPEITEVRGQLMRSDGTPASGGVIYFVFQNRLNEVPHTDPLEAVKSMSEIAGAVDTQGSFTLRMKPGNFAMVYDPSATEVPAEPGPGSMAVMKRVSKEQVQTRIAAIKENAAKGLPIANGKLGEAFVIENRYIRPPISNFGEIPLQSSAVVTVKAVDDAGELINFPATLRLRGKNGDIMEPHTPSVSTRAQYTFHDIMPQAYQVFALGSLPRPGAGDEITTPTVNNDQFVFTGDPISQDVILQQPAAN